MLAVPLIMTAQVPGQKAPGPPPTEARQTAYGLRATSGSEVLDITVCGESVIHVVATPGQPEAKPAQRPWILDAQQSCPGASFTVAQDAKAASLKIQVKLREGNKGAPLR